MSRVAKAPIVLPENVDIKIDLDSVTVKGPKGTLTQQLNKLVEVKKSTENEKQLLFIPAADNQQSWAQAGTARALVNNMVRGVTDGFVITLELVGVGFRAQVKDKVIVLTIGYSHPVEYTMPEGLTAETPNNTTLVLKGIDKQALGQVAAEIRGFRPPEPYKGKGIRYAGEAIVRKEAKKK
tara:strand:+ start:605 stop:1147 length:543 start_codon:yes stop_codon:yes gene_type:complete